MTNKLDQYAEFSFVHRRDGTTADDISADIQLSDLREAYIVQDKLVAKLMTLLDTVRFGYKIGCTSVAAQQLLNTDAPVFGQMFSALRYASPVQLDTSDFNMLVIEPEFAFTLNQDVPEGTYNADSILPYVANVIPSIEIVHHRLGGFDRFDALKVVADNAIHGAWIGGMPRSNVAALDLPNHAVTLFADGVAVSAGEGRVALGNPLSALAWIANELPKYGHRLRAGQIVTTGVCMNVYLAKQGELISADFGTLGTVEIQF